MHTFALPALLTLGRPDPDNVRFASHCLNGEPSAQEAEEQKKDDHRERHAEEPQDDRHDTVSTVDGRIKNLLLKLQVP